MSDPDESPESAGTDPAGNPGLFSQLPHTRPGTRSPRRSSSAGAGRKPPAKPRAPAGLRAKSARTEPAPAAKPRPTPRSEPPRPHAEAKPPESGSGEEGPSGIEELAWAGIAVTAEAATLGVRLVGRAFEAARKATERDRG